MTPFGLYENPNDTTLPTYLVTDFSLKTQFPESAVAREVLAYDQAYFRRIKEKNENDARYDKISVLTSKNAQAIVDLNTKKTTTFTPIIIEDDNIKGALLPPLTWIYKYNGKENVQDLVFYYMSFETNFIYKINLESIKATLEIPRSQNIPKSKNLGISDDTQNQGRSGNEITPDEVLSELITRLNNSIELIDYNTGSSHFQLKI